MAKKRRYRWRGFGEQALNPPKWRIASPTDSSYQVAARNLPATGKQINFLRDLRRRFGIPLGDLDQLSRIRASEEIDRLQQRRE